MEVERDWVRGWVGWEVGSGELKEGSRCCKRSKSERGSEERTNSDLDSASFPKQSLLDRLDAFGGLPAVFFSGLRRRKDRKRRLCCCWRWEDGGRDDIGGDGLRRSVKRRVDHKERREGFGSERDWRSDLKLRER